MLLRMCPHAWQSQYNMNQTMLPQDTNWLLAVLENFENAVLQSPTYLPSLPIQTGTTKTEYPRKMENAIPFLC
jgi:hypothetical protein